jgi:hypothetical protein
VGSSTAKAILRGVTEKATDDFLANADGMNASPQAVVINASVARREILIVPTARRHQLDYR